MTKLCCEVLERLRGKTLVTAESLTGGGIGAALTAIPGSSAVYKGGVISYTNWVKENILRVPEEILDKYGAVSQWTAGFMASGVRSLLQADAAVSVTGLAGPGGDEFGNPVGTVFIGYEDGRKAKVIACHFTGSREEIREQTIEAALKLILEENPEQRNP
ncbi:MAG: CinA family protein [Faecousia sp.]